LNTILNVGINSILLKSQKNLRKLFQNIHFQLESNSIYALVGENGKGKTTLLKSTLNLLNKSIFEIDGTIKLFGIDMMKCDSKKLEDIRKNECRYILQDAADCFDPIKKIGYYFEDEQIDDQYFVELLDYFLLPKAELIVKNYPHELSVGMAQRLAIIWGLLAKPKLFLLDEPSSALDVSIANLLSNKLKEVSITQNTSILFISQDIDFAKNTASKIGMLSENGIIEFEKKNFGNLLAPDLVDKKPFVE
jgi:ABC-type dipeptide/oligopeptide/nickel transport system ATPase component